MNRVKIKPEERKLLQELGKRAWKETKKKLRDIPPERQPTSQGHHGKKGGPQAWKSRKLVYPPCVNKETHQPEKRHRFWNGKCSLCGIEQRPTQDVFSEMGKSIPKKTPGRSGK